MFRVFMMTINKMNERNDCGKCLALLVISYSLEDDVKNWKHKKTVLKETAGCNGAWISGKCHQRINNTPKRTGAVFLMKSSLEKFFNMTYVQTKMTLRGLECRI